MSQSIPPAENSAFFDVVDALSAPSRRDIVSNIVAHPKGLPSMKELEFMTGLHRSTIYEHIDELHSAGLVETETLPEEAVKRDQPRTFYRLTESARELFDKNDVFLEAHWRELYATVSKPDEIIEAEEAPRP
ncbi:winged helix-turn-helix domain-containing protein [Halovivax limisalsi]|uniref:winged helix-turn-helix domain-containing protein n=1 Tax=Halovivax limisalsi TaxID=1453760 RepID=UPI001FFD9703|nr:winged helix-turn-helix domain-containing protein [Halovivax limisalsi]